MKTNTKLKKKGKLDLVASGMLFFLCLAVLVYAQPPVPTGVSGTITGPGAGGAWVNVTAYNTTDFLDNKTTYANSFGQYAVSLSTHSGQIINISVIAENYTYSAYGINYSYDVLAGDTPEINVTMRMPPKLNTSNPVPNITFAEETFNDSINLSEHFFDLDTGDVLIFGYWSEDNLTIAINQTADIVNITADSDFTGVRLVNFSASDSINTTWSNTIIVNVTNVNDPPSIDIPDQSTDEDITPPHHWINLSEYTTDIDNDTTTLVYAIMYESNTSLIDCFIVDSYYINCSAPAGNQPGYSNLTVNVSDGQYNDTGNFTVFVLAVNDPPVFNASNPVPNVTFAEDTFNDSINISTRFYDIDNATLVFSYWSEDNITIDINQTTGIANITADPDFYGVRLVNFSASDGINTTWSNTIKINVTPVNDDPPYIDVPDFYTNEDTTPPHQWINLSLYSGDPDEAPALTYSFAYESNASLIDCMFFDSYYINCSTPAANQSGYSNLTVNITDGVYTTWDNFTVWVAAVNDPPAFNASNPVPNVTFAEDTFNDSINISTRFYDIDNATLVFSYWAEDNITIDINQTTGIANITADPDFYGVRLVNFSASDGEYTVWSNNITINITAVDDAPVLDSIGALVAYENQTFVYDVNATDAEGDPFTFAANSTIFAINSTTGLINFTPHDADVGSYVFVINVTGSGGTDYEMVSFTVIDTISNITFNVTDRINRIPLAGITLISNSTQCPSPGCSFDYNLTLEEPNAVYSFNFSKSGFSDNVSLINVSEDASFNITMDDIENPNITYVRITAALGPQNLSFYIVVEANITENTLIKNATLNYTAYDGYDSTGSISLQHVSGNFYNGSAGPFNQSFTLSSDLQANDSYLNFDAYDVVESRFLFVKGAEVTVDNAPVLDSIPDMSTAADNLFTYDVNATDIDGDPLTFSDDTSLFDINSSTGIISFTPTASQKGLYAIGITVTDGTLSDFDAFLLTITGPNVCGDGTCSGNEDCGNCAADCGKCPPSEEIGVSRHVSGGAVLTCRPEWQCTEWSDCSINGTQERECKDINACGTISGMPEEQRECTLECVEEWECSEWLPQKCPEEGRQARVCTDLNACGTIKEKPSEQQICALEAEIPETCYDKIQDNDEEGVDCGGPCTPCPAVEKPMLLSRKILIRGGIGLGAVILVLAVIMVLSEVLVEKESEEAIERTLVPYVDYVLGKGFPKSQIKKALKEQGWSRYAIRKAFKRR